MQIDDFMLLPIFILKGRHKMKCEYGCDQEAKFQLRNGKWCCSDFYTKCPENKRKLGEIENGSEV